MFTGFPRIAHLRRWLGALALGTLLACGGGGGSPGTPPVAPGPPPVPDPAPGPPPLPQQLALIEVAKVPNAVHLAAPSGDPRQFIVDRRGRILVLDNGSLRTTAFLDISARVSTTGEGGLLSLVFDPGFSFNGYFYIAYSDLANRLTVERLTRGADPNQADPLSALPILSIPHTDFTNHYGGLLAFGPDGYLYFSTGDGGGSGDPLHNGQNLNSLLGKLLRLDVNGASAASPYRIPAGNPFAGQTGRRPEIWAVGLRNPWRYSFDNALLYMADVGQSMREEINIVDVALPGINYGWSIMEGTLCYNSATCASGGLTLPAHQYEHSSANGCSITGGEVYRGSRMPALVGSYLFSDYCGGYLKSLRYQPGGIPPAVTTWPIARVGGIVSFGHDGQGELYLINAEGVLYRIAPGAVPTG